MGQQEDDRLKIGFSPRCCLAIARCGGGFTLVDGRAKHILLKDPGYMRLRMKSSLRLRSVRLGTPDGEQVWKFYLVVLMLLSCGACNVSRKSLQSPSSGSFADEKALGVITGSRGVLAPVYGPLAEQVVADFDLAEKTGIGIDLGSGPGTLILELCKRTQMHWINADINPRFFPYFYQQAEQHCFGHRVSAIMADAHCLPFHDNYADFIVSRGSFHFWQDKVTAFSEIYRVLKPGATAYIGRGLSRNLPVETARQIRAKQGKAMKYDVEETAAELRGIMNELQIRDYRIHRPQPPGSEKVNYGVWIEFHKSEASTSGKAKEQPDGLDAR